MNLREVSSDVMMVEQCASTSLAPPAGSSGAAASVSVAARAGTVSTSPNLLAYSNHCVSAQLTTESQPW